MSSNKTAKEEKQERLSALLRENLKKRKAQMRARRNVVEQAREDIPEDISEQRDTNPPKD